MRRLRSADGSDCGAGPRGGSGPVASCTPSLFAVFTGRAPPFLRATAPPYTLDELARLPRERNAQPGPAANLSALPGPRARRRHMRPPTRRGPWTVGWARAPLPARRRRTWRSRRAPAILGASFAGYRCRIVSHRRSPSALPRKEHDMAEDDTRAPPRRAGPIDVGLWPSQLTARVVDGGFRPRILGYDVQTDLARHYSFAEVVLLCLCGEVPTREVGRAFEIALSFLAPVSAAEAPAHAAGLAH